MSPTSTNYDYDFDPQLPNNTAAAIYRYVVAGGERVLDLGSGPGIVAARLKEVEGKDVICLDADPTYLHAAQERGIERTIQADLEDPDWPEELKGSRFDVIVLADVLEHLVDPGAVLDRIRDEGLLADEGHLVVSIPNASHEAVVLSLLAGRFTYTESGILDATHLRWFTKDSFRELAEAHGYLVSRIHRTIRTVHQTQQRGVLLEGFSEAVRQELAARPELEARTYQYVMRLDPMDGATQLAALRAEAEQERSARVEAATQHEAAMRQLREESRVLETSLDESLKDRARRDELAARLSADLIALSAESARERDEHRGKIEACEKRVAALQQERDELLQLREDTRREVADELREAEEQLNQTRAEVHAARGTADVARREADVAREDAQAARRELEAVFQSETWRTGAAVMWLPRKVKLMGRGRR